MEPEEKSSGLRREHKREAKCVRNLLLPSRSNLHTVARLAFAALANVVLAVWVLPQVGHVTDPTHSPANAFWTCLEVLLPCAVLLVLLPVFVFGRDVPRLLAIGLSFLPGYIAVAGVGAALSLWSSGR